MNMLPDRNDDLMKDPDFREEFKRLEADFRIIEQNVLPLASDDDEDDLPS